MAKTDLLKLLAIELRLINRDYFQKRALHFNSRALLNIRSP
ncbi:hypothetical protein CHISP_0553 [Chitinispirillum alkaliphilum]|nr:hypothetical protein CHISP_0553 [Chitinispirillum alkaliphilum]